jgi:hypothetical protein
MAAKAHTMRAIPSRRSTCESIRIAAQMARGFPQRRCRRMKSGSNGSKDHDNIPCNSTPGEGARFTPWCRSTGSWTSATQCICAESIRYERGLDVLDSTRMTKNCVGLALFPRSSAVRPEPRSSCVFSHISHTMRRKLCRRDPAGRVGDVMPRPRPASTRRLMRKLTMARTTGLEPASSAVTTPSGAQRHVW